MVNKKVLVTVEYSKPGTQPPVYLAGSFSEPGWHPEEMEYTTEGLEHQFHKELLVEEGGNFQYKFRIGPGDWWVLNEDSPTVTDDVGNRNNILAVPISKPKIDVDTDTKRSDSEEIQIVSPQPERQIPILVAEKMDSTPSSGNNFRTVATFSQKDADDKTAQDAEPNHVLVGSEDNTPLYANTAAEVADSAAIVDREDSPLPVSDEIAGRTGERRMSFTPISQVAATAADVADSAAKLDLDEKDDHLDLPIFKYLPNVTEPSAGAVSPWNEDVPLFDHECPEIYDGEPEEPLSSEVYQNNHSGSVYEEEEDESALEDPTLEEFPCDREAIIARVRSTSTRLEPDEVRFNGEESSPLFSGHHSSGSLEPPSPALLSHQPSPNLDVITEEYPEMGEEFSLPKAGGSDSDKLPEFSIVPDEPKPPINIPKLASVIKEPDFKGIDMEEIEAMGGIPAITAPAAMAEVISVTEDLPTSCEDMTIENAFIPEPDTVPEISIIPATPAGTFRSNERVLKSEEPSAEVSIESTAIIHEEEVNIASSGLKKRLVPSMERPPTPVSIRSSVKDKNNSGLFLTIWRTIFVGWIGGLLTRLFGGRRESFITLAILFAVAPALYFFI